MPQHTTKKQKKKYGGQISHLSFRFFRMTETHLTDNQKLFHSGQTLIQDRQKEGLCLTANLRYAG
jgi:hypothetical protein